MKLFVSVEEMEAVPKVRRPKSIHTTDQIVAQAARLGWTVGVTAEDLVGQQCGAVIGLHPQDEKWLSGEHMTGVWFETVADASAHSPPASPASRCLASPSGDFRKWTAQFYSEPRAKTRRSASDRESRGDRLLHAVLRSL
jgi:hypothetical protein